MEIWKRTYVVELDLGKGLGQYWMCLIKER
jgi:hypothetical protein